jgi:hypothetical protein
MGRGRTDLDAALTAVQVTRPPCRKSPENTGVYSEFRMLRTAKPIHDRKRNQRFTQLCSLKDDHAK